MPLETKIEKIELGKVNLSNPCRIKFLSENTYVYDDLSDTEEVEVGNGEFELYVKTTSSILFHGDRQYGPFHQFHDFCSEDPLALKKFGLFGDKLIYLARSNGQDFIFCDGEKISRGAQYIPDYEFCDGSIVYKTINDGSAQVYSGTELLYTPPKDWVIGDLVIINNKLAFRVSDKEKNSAQAFMFFDRKEKGKDECVYVGEARDIHHQLAYRFKKKDGLYQVVYGRQISDEFTFVGYPWPVGNTVGFATDGWGLNITLFDGSPIDLPDEYHQLSEDSNHRILFGLNSTPLFTAVKYGVGGNLNEKGEFYPKRLITLFLGSSPFDGAFNESSFGADLALSGSTLEEKVKGVLTNLTQYKYNNSRKKIYSIDYSHVSEDSFALAFWVKGAQNSEELKVILSGQGDQGKVFGPYASAKEYSQINSKPVVVVADKITRYKGRRIPHGKRSIQIGDEKVDEEFDDIQLVRKTKEGLSFYGIRYGEKDSLLKVTVKGY